MGNQSDIDHNANNEADGPFKWIYELIKSYYTFNGLCLCKMCRVEGVVGTQSHMDSQRTTGFHNLL